MAKEGFIRIPGRLVSDAFAESHEGGFSIFLRLQTPDSFGLKKKRFKLAAIRAYTTARALLAVLIDGKAVECLAQHQASGELIVEFVKVDSTDYALHRAPDSDPHPTPSSTTLPQADHPSEPPPSKRFYLLEID